MTRVEVLMPHLGYDMESGKIAAWTKRVGDRVNRGEVIAEVETDKAIVEMEALVSGVLSEIRSKEGEVVAIDSVIAIIDVAE